MRWWTPEQALCWGMWRDEARAETCGEGRRGAIEARQLAEVPILSDAERQRIVGELLERGEISFTPMPASGPDCGFEERGLEHEESGCYVSLRGWRERAGAPLCILEALHWVSPREEPILEYLAAKGELEQALREGRVHATGEGPTGEPIDLPPKSWLYAELVLTNDFSGMLNQRSPAGSKIGRLRFPVDDVKAVWPDEGELDPSPSQRPGYQRKRGRPPTPIETHVTLARAMLQRGQQRKEVLAVLRDAIARERGIGSDPALKEAKRILAEASVQNS